MEPLDVIMIFMLLLIFIEDLRHRGVSLLLMLALTLTIILYGKSHLDTDVFIRQSILNMSIVLALVVISIMISLVILKQAGIGAGDLWMLILCSFSMETILLPFFLIISFLISLMGYYVGKKSKRPWETIPLAGIASACLAILVFLDSVSPFDRFQELPSLQSITFKQ